MKIISIQSTKMAIHIGAVVWSWSCDGWIYNYLCNRCLSPLMLRVRISLRARCTTLCDKVCYLRQAGGFLRVLRFSQPIKLITMI